MTTGATLVLTRGDVQHFVSLTDCIAAVEHAFRMHGEEKTQAPGMMGIHSSEGDFTSRRAFCNWPITILPPR